MSSASRDTPATAAAFDCEIMPASYHFSAAAARISRTNSTGLSRSALNADSGRSISMCMAAS